jgi:hypothetical protein
MATVADIQARYPKLTAAQAKRVVELLERAPAAVTRIWAGEDQMTGKPAKADAHGLTPAMRELNDFADENALPIPFPPK